MSAPVGVTCCRHSPLARSVAPAQIASGPRHPGTDSLASPWSAGGAPPGPWLRHRFPRNVAARRYCRVAGPSWRLVTTLSSAPAVEPAGLPSGLWFKRIKYEEYLFQFIPQFARSTKTRNRMHIWPEAKDWWNSPSSTSSRYES